MSSYQPFSYSQEKASWDPFLTSLARAERAAAEQCNYIADALAGLGESEQARNYHLIGLEEQQHIVMVQELCRNGTHLPARTEAIFEGKLLSENPSLVERMAVFHLAFETSALAFLGYLYPRVEQHFPDTGRARQIRQVFGDILRQEVSHISQGKAAVLKLLDGADATTRNTVARSLQRHHAFLRIGLKSFFKDREDHPFVREMIRNYQKRFGRAVDGVIA